MVDFKIKRGLSTTMFIAPGVINPRLLIEEGYWYLCTDTADLFLGVKEVSDSGEETFSLKRINGAATTISPGDSNAEITDLQLIIRELQEKVAVLEDIDLFHRITGEADLPSNFDSEDFNPNITYYTYNREKGILHTYIYDDFTNSYLCSVSPDSTGLGINKVEINANGELVVQYTNGTLDIVGKVVGADGLTTSIKVGSKLYTQTNGVIELPAFATQEYVEKLLSELEIPKIPTKLSEFENDLGFITEHQDLSAYAKKSEIPSIEGLASEAYVRTAIAQAELGDSNVDLSDYVTKDILTDYATEDFVTSSFNNTLETVILHGGDATPENSDD